MNLDAGIFVAGHRGMVGSAIVRALKAKGFSNIILKTSSELDLTNQDAVKNTNQNMFIWLQRKWEASTPITPTERISSIAI
jgi:nucleoside-diphosphate-sugar epimerase